MLSRPSGLEDLGDRRKHAPLFGIESLHPSRYVLVNAAGQSVIEVEDEEVLSRIESLRNEAGVFTGGSGATVGSRELPRAKWGRGMARPSCKDEQTLMPQSALLI